MTSNGSDRSSLATSLPGILTGIAALITAVSGLAIWHHHQPKPQVNPQPAIVQAEHPASGKEKKEKAGKDEQGSSGAPVSPGKSDAPGQAATQPAAPPALGEQGSRPWCDQQLSDWSAKMAKGTDDAGIRKAFKEGNCKLYGLKLPKPQATQ